MTVRNNVFDTAIAWELLDDSERIARVTMYMWRFPKMGVTPKSSILLGFSWGLGDFPVSTIQLLGYPHDYGNPAWKKVLSNTVRHWKCVPWAVVHWASRLKRGETTQTIGVTSHLLRIYITHAQLNQYVFKKTNMPKIHTVPSMTPQKWGVFKTKPFRSEGFGMVWPWDLEVLAKYGKMKGSLPEKTRLEVCS